MKNIEQLSDFVSRILPVDITYDNYNQVILYTNKKRLTSKQDIALGKLFPNGGLEKGDGGYLIIYTGFKVSATGKLKVFHG